MSYVRPDGRAPDQLRPVEIIPNFTKWAEGSVLCSFGDTRVLCNATLEERVPPWMKDQGRGWVTGEYSMLPRSTDRRMQRESIQGKIGGRTHEISRLIGRSLRAGVDLELLGERTVTIDCDVLQADGGTRTAAVTGGWVAMALAIRRLMKQGTLRRDPLVHQVAAVSIGIVHGSVLLDLAFVEDQNADTDLNLVMNDASGIIEVQGTAEGVTFTKSELDAMLESGSRGIAQLFAHQKAALEVPR
jgi:ribonuclease PH